MSPLGPSLCIALLFAQPAATNESNSSIRVTDSQAYNQIVGALDEQTELEIVDGSLEDAMAQIANRHHINVVVDELAVRTAEKEFEILRDNVSLIVSNITLRSALKLLLDPLELDFVIEDEVLMVTSREAAKNNQGTHAYDVSDLIHGDTVGELAEAVHTALPQSVQESASISGYRNLMLVTGNREVHESVSRILHLIKGGLREVKAPTPTF
ncbi:MAG: hypothetical protein KDA93_04270 [Planctomycetaceae bacterium]|nr:hypothetical protein [Planctomycetaceae bacterium]